MSNGLPTKAKVVGSISAGSASIDPATYLIATRMERVGMLRPGQALMLAATLPATAAPRGKSKRVKK